VGRELVFAALRQSLIIDRRARVLVRLADDGRWKLVEAVA
jgi:hypothetical protein